MGTDTTTGDAPGPQRRSPLYSRHEALGASFTDFAGWDMPLQYSSALEEHRAVRERAGLFDLSHMGELWVRGPGAVELLNRTFVSDFAKLRIGRAKYTVLCNDAGGIVDDLIVYRLDDEEFMVVPNAANVAAVLQSLQAAAPGVEGVGVEDATASTALIAVQGPRAEEVLVAALESHGSHPAEVEAVRELRYYAAMRLLVAGVPAVVARTGYTGEDGFELFVPAGLAGDLWDLFTQVGKHAGLVPAGLGARDSLRLEAGMPLCGHELTADTAPSQVGSGRVVSLSKPQDFPGREALERLAERIESGDSGAPVLVGLRAHTRRAMRAGCEVLAEVRPAPTPVDDEGGLGADQELLPVGVITSGLFSPTLGDAIAMALVDPRVARVGTEVVVDVRGRPQPATVTGVSTSGSLRFLPSHH